MHNYHSHGHAQYALNYHLLWCPRSPLPLKRGALEETMKEIIAEICEKYGYGILMMEVQSRYIHVSLSVHPTVAPTDIVRNLKSLCTIGLLRLHPEIKKHYSVYGSLWKKGYLITTGEIINPDEMWEKLDE